MQTLYAYEYQLLHCTCVVMKVCAGIYTINHSLVLKSAELTQVTDIARLHVQQYMHITNEYVLQMFDMSHEII